MIKNFEEGEMVTFEVIRTNNDTQPRWSGDTDYKPSHMSYKPIYAVGFVTKVYTNDRFVVDKCDGCDTSWTWPQPSDQNYKNSYGQPGYIRRVGEASVKVEVTVNNNDGRTTCAWCGAPTRSCGGFGFGIDYRVCTKCGK